MTTLLPLSDVPSPKTDRTNNGIQIVVEMDHEFSHPAAAQRDKYQVRGPASLEPNMNSNTVKIIPINK